MHALLTCLDRPHRLAYILGEILELEGPEAARILGISAAAFRKRLSRARDAIVMFTRGALRSRRGSKSLSLRSTFAPRAGARTRR